MSREIKFRVWDTKFNSWAIPYDEQCIPRLWIGKDGCLVFSNLAAVTEKTSIIEQSTGLRDKNGKLIYEGDVIKDGHAIYQVLFGPYEDDLSQQVGVGFFLEQADGFFQPLCQRNRFTIIGNVHENPELLEKK